MIKDLVNIGKCYLKYDNCQQNEKESTYYKIITKCDRIFIFLKSFILHSPLQVMSY